MWYSTWLTHNTDPSRDCNTLATELSTIIYIYSVVFFTAVLVGNKTDLMDRRIITTESAKSFAQGNGMEYFECSAVRDPLQFQGGKIPSFCFIWDGIA